MRVSNTSRRRPRSKGGTAFYRFPKAVVPALARAADAALALRKKVRPGEISVVLVSDGEIKRLNRTYRKVNRVTDVISFRYPGAALSGDIFVARGRSRKQAAAQRHPWERELVYLVIHGVLHLLGYTDYAPRERAKMFTVQDRVFRDCAPSPRTARQTF